MVKFRLLGRRPTKPQGPDDSGRVKRQGYRPVMMAWRVGAHTEALT